MNTFSIPTFIVIGKQDEELVRKAPHRILDFGFWILDV
jgi:hypothetical protein